MTMGQTDPFSDFLMKLSLNLAEKLLEASARRVRRAYEGDERQVALERSLAEGLADALAGFDLSADEQNHLESLFSEYFTRMEVSDELSGLLDPRPGDQLDLELLLDEFKAAGYDPGTLPGFDFYEFIVRFVDEFYNAAARQDALEGVLQIGLLRDMAERMGALVEVNQRTADASEASADTLDEIKEILAETGDRRGYEKLLQAYYRSLAGECRKLPLGVIDVRFIKEHGEVDVSLERVYVDLDVVKTHAPQEEKEARDWAQRLWRGEGRERVPLLEAMLQPGNREMVLLGEAGSGKTTFVNYLAYLLAQGIASGVDDKRLPASLRGILPVRLALRDVAARCIPADTECGEAGMLWRALREDIEIRLGDDAAGILFPVLRNRLLDEGGLILLDGLDEVPEAGRRRKALLEAVRAFAGVLPEKQTLIVVTARPYAYAEPEWRLQNFSILALAAFSDEQIEHFVQRFYTAVRASMGWDQAEADRRAAQLEKALGERVYLKDLASRPLLLTLMTTLHSSWGQLPEDRADLYEETVKLLLGRWQRARQRTGPDGEFFEEPGITQVLEVDEMELRTALEALAFHAHERQGEGQVRDDAPADVSEGEVLVAFKPLMGKLAPDILLGYLKERAGLLVARREGVYAFPHRSFQEYLAACHLADQPEFGVKLRELLYQDPAWWREVSLLGVGRARRGGMGSATSVVNQLLPDDPDPMIVVSDNHWYTASLAGMALVELRLIEEAQDQPVYQALIKRSQRWLKELLEDGHLSPRLRAEAGNTLAALGDPRFDPGRWYLPQDPTLGFRRVLAGRFTMGSDLEVDGHAHEDEQPQHQVEMPEYWIARYPVTVGQFLAFVSESGYKPAYARSLDGALNHPVVAVTWYDAQAYCEWLNGKLHGLAGEMVDRASGEAERGFWDGLADGTARIQLPSEAQWEKAARGDQGRIYPWEGAFDPQKANTVETGIGAPSPVGCFPGGESVYQALDMSGNVWEWCSDWFDEDAYAGREEVVTRDPPGPSTGKYRALRGGAWYYDNGFARSAFRNRDVPDLRSDDFGFRCACSL